jgi:mono/diheme cytochrome c family protein
MKKAILIFSLLMLIKLAYCAPNVLPPTSAQLTQIKNADPAADTTAINNGYAVFAEKCQKCHKLKDPAKFTAEDWNKILPKMSKKAKLTDEQTALVHTYVMAFCKKP